MRLSQQFGALFLPRYSSMSPRDMNLKAGMSPQLSSLSQDLCSLYRTYTSIGKGNKYENTHQRTQSTI